MKSIIFVLTSSLVSSEFVIGEQTWVPSMIIDYYLILYNLYYDPAICTRSLGKGLGRRPLNSARVGLSRKFWSGETFDLTLNSPPEDRDRNPRPSNHVWCHHAQQLSFMRNLGYHRSSHMAGSIMHAYVDLAPQTTKATHQIEHGDGDSRRSHRVW